MRPMVILAALACVAILCSTCACIYDNDEEDEAQDGSGQGDENGNATQETDQVVLTTDSGKKLRINVTMADEPVERAKGLMYVEDLGRFDGMLFIFDKVANESFWMKDTLIPLDIVFISEDMTIINIEEAEPGGDLPDDELPIYKSDSPCLYVLEVNLGTCKRYGIEEGDQIELALVETSND